MSVATYDVKEQWIGEADTSAYTFDFKIQDSKYILLILQDNLGNQVSRVRGNDTTVLLSSISFDPIKGGGTLNLIDPLPTDYVLTALLANDYPTQPSVFGNKFSFTLELFEQALDYMMSPIQRLAYLARRSVKLSDLDDITTFDPTLPPKIVLNPGGIFSVKSDGTGFEFVVTTGMIAAAAANAAAAAASAAAALVSQNAAAASAGAAAIMQWQKVTLTFDQFAAAALSNSQPLFTLPAKQLLIGLMIKHSVPFAGPAVASLALGVGVAGDTGKFITAFDGLQAVADTAYESNLEQYMGSFAGSTAIQVTATSSGANLSALTQGSVDVWYQAAQLP